MPRESGRAMRAAVFYEPEYRELCLQQLSSFNPDRMSIGKYLTVLCRSGSRLAGFVSSLFKNITSPCQNTSIKKNILMILPFLNAL